MHNDVGTAETTDISNNKLFLLSLEVMVVLLQTKFHTSTASAAHKKPAAGREPSRQGVFTSVFWAYFGFLLILNVLLITSTRYCIISKTNCFIWLPECHVFFTLDNTYNCIKSDLSQLVLLAKIAPKEIEKYDGFLWFTRFNNPCHVQRSKNYWYDI